MKFLNIVKDGIDNVVDEAVYEAVYKPVGWKIAGVNPIVPELTKSPNDEIVKKNINKMKKSTVQKINDKLIKGEGNG